MELSETKSDQLHVRIKPTLKSIAKESSELQGISLARFIEEAIISKLEADKDAKSKKH